MRVSTKIANYIVRQFNGKTADEIQTMMDEFQSLTQTNCWWLEYHLKAVLLEVAENELQLLKDKMLQVEPAADSDVVEAEFVEENGK